MIWQAGCGLSPAVARATPHSALEQPRSFKVWRLPADMAESPSVHRCYDCGLGATSFSICSHCNAQFCSWRCLERHVLLSHPQGTTDPRYGGRLLHEGPAVLATNDTALLPSASSMLPLPPRYGGQEGQTPLSCGFPAVKTCPVSGGCRRHQAYLNTQSVPQAQAAVIAFRHAPLRRDHPPCNERKRGSRARAMDIAADIDLLAAAQAKFDNDIYAPSTRDPRDSKAKTWTDVARLLGFYLATWIRLKCAESWPS